MPKPTFDILQLEAQVADLLSEIAELSTAIRRTLPQEILLTQGGTPNLRNKWGALLFNLQQTSSTIRAFAPKED